MKFTNDFKRVIKIHYKNFWNVFIKIFEKEEIFEAFTYVYNNGAVAGSAQMTFYIRWLKDVSIIGTSSKEREKEAYEIFRKQNNLKKGQVWIYGNLIRKNNLK